MGLEEFSENGNYLILAFDHREKFKKYINSKSPDEVTETEIITSIKKIIENLKSDFSGILLDEKYSLPAFRDTEIEKPFLLPIDNSELEISNNGKFSISSDDYSNFKNLGASGVKLSVQQDSNPENENRKMEAVKKSVEVAHSNGMPILINVTPEDTDNTDKVLRSIQIFIDKNVLPDIFAVEFPGSEYLCQKLTRILGGTPWILVTEAVDFTLFQEQLRMACDSGCRGFLAGRSLWQEYFGIKDLAMKEQFLEKVLPLRFEKIRDIVVNS